APGALMLRAVRRRGAAAVSVCKTARAPCNPSCQSRQCSTHAPRDSAGPMEAMVTLAHRPGPRGQTPARRRRTPWLGALLCALSCFATGGCVAFSNPVGQGVPVSRLPPEFLAEPKSGYVYIPLTALRQPVTAAYRLDKGDTLGIYIEGVLGEKTQPPP